MEIIPQENIGDKICFIYVHIFVEETNAYLE